MRQIKFRVWDSISKTMHEWYHVKSISLVDFELEHYTLMQFTGLHDEKGKEIYEGDICAYFFEDAVIERRLVKNPGYELGVIKYDNGGFYLAKDKETTNDSDLLFGAWFTGEVMGNIYETSELLK